MTAHPNQVPGPRATAPARLSGELAVLGLEVTVSARSAWWPGSTILLLIAAKGVDHNHA